MKKADADNDRWMEFLDRKVEEIDEWSKKENIPADYGIISFRRSNGDFVLTVGHNDTSLSALEGREKYLYLTISALITSYVHQFGSDSAKLDLINFKKSFIKGIGNG